MSKITGSRTLIRSGVGKRSRFIKPKKRALKSRVRRLEKKLLQGEVKYDTTQFTGTVSAGSPVFLNPVQIAQGDADDQRIGNKIMIKSLQIRAYFNNNLTTPSNNYRMVIFKANKNAPNANELFDSGVTDGLKAFRNPDYLKNYKVIKDIIVSKTNRAIWDSFANVAQYPVSFRMHQLYFTLEMPFHYTGGTSLDIADNSLNVVLFCGEGTPGAVIYDLDCKIRYTDI